MADDISAKSCELLDSWLRFRHQRCDIPGIAVGIAIKGKLVFNKTYGYANLETKEQLTGEHVFRIASHSKTFTATAIMQLVQDGKLSIDVPVVRYLPWLAKHKDKRIKRVTARQLLSHSAGVIRDGFDADYWHLSYDFPSEKKLKEDLSQTHLILDTNRQMKYSNYGYGLLGLLVEACSGVSFAAYVRKNILSPLKLRNTGTEFKKSIVGKLVTGYSRAESVGKREAVSGQANTRALAAATGFYSNCKDLCTYFSAHLLGSGLLLDDEEKKEMQRTQWKVTNSTFGQEYGLGFQIDHIGSMRVFGHAGGFPGQATRTFCDPATETVVSVMTNAVDADPTWIARGIFGFLSHCRANAENRDSKKLERFQARLMGFFRVSDVLVSGNRLISVFSNSWNPFWEDYEVLEYVDDNTLKIVRAHGYSSEGELVHYSFAADGSVKAVKYAGVTLLPEKEYLKAKRSKQRKK